MSSNFDLQRVRIAVIGLGYVGLPLAVELGKHYPTVGFDIDAGRIKELRAGRDRSLEVEPREFKAATGLAYTDGADDGTVIYLLFIIKLLDTIVCALSY